MNSHHPDNSRPGEDVERDNLHAFEDLLYQTPASTVTELDLEGLRGLCADGIPNQPLQIRPLAYSLLLKTLPTDKKLWRKSERQQRSLYYDLVDKLGGDDRLSDKILLGIDTDVEPLTKRYPILKHRANQATSSSLNPHFDPGSDSESDIEVPISIGRSNGSPSESSIGKSKGKLSSRRAIFSRLKSLKTPAPTVATPTITISSDSSSSPAASSSKVFRKSKVVSSESRSQQQERFDSHSDALIRMMAVYASQHSYQPEFFAILAPLYLTYCCFGQGTTFAEEHGYWAFESLMQATKAIRQNSDGHLQAVGSSLEQADEHLYSVLVSHDLDPAGPLYLYRWQQTLFADTLSLSNLIPVLDTLISSQDKALTVVQLCTALLLVTKPRLCRSKVSKGLFGNHSEEDDVDFVQALTTLRHPPLDPVAGSAAILGALAAILQSSIPIEIPLATPVRSDASSPNKEDLSSRLSKLMSTSAAKNGPTPPRPLLLVDKARRASTPSSLNMRRSSTESSLIFESTLSPPTTGVNGLYRIGSHSANEAPLPQRVLQYEPILQSLIAVVGLAKRRPPIRLARVYACSVRRLLSTTNYPDHVPLNTPQNALLAVGSGVMGVLDTTRGDLVATLSESSAATFLPALHAKMMSHPEGRQILRDQPIVSSKTVNLDYLSSLRRGTLGREYVEWLRRGNLTPDSREKVRYIDSPNLAYTMLRYRQTHDLYHTLFSLPPTLPHELSLKVVELSNMSLPVAGLSSLFGPFRLSNQRRELWLKDWVPWALRVGEEGRSLVGIYWEKRWEQGLGQLRRELGVYRNESNLVESRWKGYRDVREMERNLRRKGEWVDEPEIW